MKKTKQAVRKKGKKEQTKLTRNVIEIILAFVVAFLIYQAVAFGTGTPMPIVSVVSHSMYHDQPFDAWWQENSQFYLSQNITIEDFQGFPMNNGLSRGDLLFVVNDDAPQIGDVIIYNKFTGFTIVHRIIDIEGDTIITKGDNNRIQDTPVHKSQVVGKAVVSIPLLGYPRLALFAIGI